MNERDIGTLWIGATRYYLGRMTYAVSDFCEALRAEWARLPESVRGIIKRDIEAEFDRDDKYRTAHVGRPPFSGCHPLGQDCDRRQWERVRELWKEGA